MPLADDMTAMNEPATTRFDFERIASRYDAWYRTDRGAMYDLLEKRAIDGLLPAASRDSKLLEVGCGTGHFSDHFAGRGFEVTGIDISEPMIARARQENITNSTFELANAERLPFADETFDVAAAITALEFVSDPANAVSEMARSVKKPGGTLIFGVLNRLCAYNQDRKRRAASVYASASLFSPDDLRHLLKPYGTVTILVAGFVPRRDAFVWLSPLLERIERLTGNQHGAFLAAKVVL